MPWFPSPTPSPSPSPAALASLVEVSLRNNGLFGELPAAMGVGIPNVRVLDLSFNRIVGTIPISWYGAALASITKSSFRLF